MAVRTSLSARGMEEMFADLAQMGRDIDEIADEALIAGAKVILARQKLEVAKDTWNLEEHLVISPIKQEGNFHAVDIGMPNDPLPDAETARYGNAQEYGTSSMDAHPYIRPGFDLDGVKARAAMRKVLQEWLKK